MARILLADDYESMRMAVRSLIKTHPGWEICGEADDGRKAVKKATELKPDLILLDFIPRRPDPQETGAPRSARCPQKMRFAPEGVLPRPYPPYLALLSLHFR